MKHALARSPIISAWKREKFNAILSFQHDGQSSMNQPTLIFLDAQVIGTMRQAQLRCRKARLARQQRHGRMPRRPQPTTCCNHHSHDAKKPLLLQPASLALRVRQPQHGTHGRVSESHSAICLYTLPPHFCEAVDQASRIRTTSQTFSAENWSISWQAARSSFIATLNAAAYNSPSWRSNIPKLVTFLMKSIASVVRPASRAMRARATKSFRWSMVHGFY
mmetsp:Transcript_88456/g.202357  ORF Transcript_88456/g.202357 Transcript_88456/m.202357 type:complete len:220 (+) Transcript_88456:200-859(+)